MANPTAPLSTVFATIATWVEDRFSLNELKAMGAKKTVPVHKTSLWYYLGGVALILLVIQTLTGGLLMAHYIPEIGSAHASVQQINNKVEFGWLIRSMHSWGANIMILALFVHMFSTFFMRAYRPPREITWLTGMVMLVVAFGFGFTGYLLPWDEVSFFATKIGVDISSKSPLIGDILGNLLRGGADIGQGTISRFFMIHVFVLPLVLMGLLGLHLMMIQFHGISEPEGYQKLPEGEKKREPFFPAFMLKDAVVWLLVITGVVLLSALAPWGLGPEANPYNPAPAGIKPEWYFLAMFQFLKLVPPHVGPMEGEQAGMVFFGLIGGGLAMAPFIDRGHNPFIARMMRLFGIAVLIGLIVFTIWGYMS
ncbi:MAG: cytochrome bc complex cytochrome b subunit [Vampirovibrionales bacterium]|nr:cytochrome bc complex cytochrome b subunit [Vampirovibrionales bacterium]